MKIRLPAKTSTRAELFIIESLKFADEEKERFEGRILADILALRGKQCRYYYIRTEIELRRVLKKFTESGYRYLHISCHANDQNMGTTLDTIPITLLAEILIPHLNKRRLFLSACSLASDPLAGLVMPASGCTSMLGPCKDVFFSDAAILWASLYHVMFAWDSASMKGTVLRKNAQAVSDMYHVPMNYYGRDRQTERGYISRKIVPRDPVPT